MASVADGAEDDKEATAAAARARGRVGLLLRATPGTPRAGDRNPEPRHHRGEPAGQDDSPSSLFVSFRRFFSYLFYFLLNETQSLIFEEFRRRAVYFGEYRNHDGLHNETPVGIDVKTPPAAGADGQTNMHERLQKGKEKVGGRVVQGASSPRARRPALPALARARPLKFKCAPNGHRAPRRFRHFPPQMHQQRFVNRCYSFLLKKCSSLSLFLAVDGPAQAIDRTRPGTRACKMNKINSALLHAVCHASVVCLPPPRIISNHTDGFLATPRCIAKGQPLTGPQ